MPQAIVLRILVTGILAIVPSKKDPDLTRIVVPNHMQANVKHKGVPEHFAFLEVRSSNVLVDENHKPDRLPNLKYRVNDENDERWVYILRSEEISLEIPPTNQKLVKSPVVPKKILEPTEDELQSPVYELKMKYLCPHCPPIAEEYFDIRNESKVAARMDLHGGDESVRGVEPKEVWNLPGKKHDQPFAEKVAYQFNIPAATETLVIKNQAGTLTHIFLKPDAKGEVEVTLGNGPLVSILQLDRAFHGAHAEDHFKLIYDLYEPRPVHCPVPKLKKRKQDDVIGPHDNCKPPGTRKQDPAK